MAIKLAAPKINKKHRGDVQVLRAVAVLLVIAYHLKLIKGGFLGVDIFFVISGFVITSNLVKSQGSLKEKLREFYLRRAKRILPASLAVVIITALLTKIFLAPIYQSRFKLDALFSSLMGANIGFGIHKLDYLQATTSPSPFLHYWSLGVEEQFYIIWPVIFFSFIGLRKKIYAWLLPVAVVVALVSTALFPVFSFYLPTSRAFQFLFGAALVVADKFKGDKNVLAFFGWLGIFASALLIPDTLANPNRFSMIPTICTALVIWAKAEVFDLKPLIYIGEVSFTLYLVHWPIILLLGNGTQNIHGINIVVTLLLMVIATMALSIFIEIPFRNQVFGVISLRGWLVILTLATVIAQLVYLLPGKSGIALDLSKPAVYTNGCHLDQRHAKLNTNCTWGNSDAQKVLLVGDSHAAQWFPALKKLADGGAINLTSQTKSSCPATLNQVYAAGQIDKSCNTWHQNIINLIKSSNFDYIYFSNFDNYGYRTSSNWNAGIDNFVAIASAKSKVIQILDIPKPPSDLVACLSTNSKNLSACDFAAPRTLRLVNPNVTYLDPTPWLCDVGICSAYKDGVNVYRDGSHLSVTTAEKLSERLRAP